MKKSAFALLLALVASTLFAQTGPGLEGGYRIETPWNLPYLTMTIHKKELSLFSKEGVEHTFDWALHGDLLILGDVGYYLKWSKTKSGQWKLTLTPASDVGNVAVTAVKEW